jgi:signal transduction histidine kinase
VISLRRVLIALAALAFACGLGALPLILGSDHQSPRGLVAALVLTSAWGFVGTGLYAWYRRPRNRTGPLMTAVGFSWFVFALASSNNAYVFALGSLAAALPFAILIHLLVGFPAGRLRSGAQRFVVGATYLLVTVAQLAWFLFAEPSAEGCDGCPANPIRIDGHTALGEAINTAEVLVAIGLIAGAVAIVVRRWRESTPDQRRALSPVVFTGSLAFALLLVQLAASGAQVSERVEQVAFIASIVVFACLPFAFLIGLLRSRIGRDEEIRSALSAENEQLNEELRAKVEELRASRARIVEAGYEERRRVERDLHDGAQQRLLALAMTLRLARGKLESEPAVSRALLDEAIEELATATGELRELARGIHPAVLTDRGLAAALGGLAGRSPLPVEVLETPAERLPAAVESAAYFVVAEALTNVARYAHAGGATVSVQRSDGVVEVEVRDDGVGGANPEAGTGLRGLRDRVAALGGELAVSSPAGDGTAVRASIPLAG